MYKNLTNFHEFEMYEYIFVTPGAQVVCVCVWGGLINPPHPSCGGATVTYY